MLLNFCGLILVCLTCLSNTKDCSLFVVMENKLDQRLALMSRLDRRLVVTVL